MVYECTNGKETTMATQYFVTAVVDCEECGGAKWVQHPGWRELRAENHASGGVDGWTNDQLDDWFCDRGYRETPDEEWRCPECHGVGSFERRARLEEALNGIDPNTVELMINLDRIERTGDETAGEYRDAFCDQCGGDVQAICRYGIWQCAECGRAVEVDDATSDA